MSEFYEDTLYVGLYRNQGRSSHLGLKLNYWYEPRWIQTTKVRGVHGGNVMMTDWLWTTVQWNWMASAWNIKSKIMVIWSDTSSRFIVSIQYCWLVGTWQEGKEYALQCRPVNGLKFSCNEGTKRIPLKPINRFVCALNCSASALSS